MGLIGELLGSLRGGIRAEGNPNDERYWSPYLGAAISSAGVPVSPRIAMQVSCIFLGVRLVAETLGSLPLKMTRKKKSGTKEPITEHPLLEVLRDEANAWQTGQEWRETMIAHAMLWGPGTSEIIPGSRGAVAELAPIDPDAIVVEQLENRRLRYQIQEAAQTRTLLDDEVFRLPGLGYHRFMPANVMYLARETIGHWLAMEKFNSLYFAQGTSQSVWLKHPKKLGDATYNRLREQNQQRLGGPENAHRVKIAEDGMEPVAIGFSARDSQMNESWESAVRQAARWTNVPEHMLKSGKQPTYASIEMFAREFVDYSLAPWAIRFENRIRRDLLADDEKDLYVEHLFDGLLRGNTTERAGAYRVFVEMGVMTRNEVRTREGLEPLEGLDEPLTPLNMERTGAERGDEPPTPPAPPARRASPEDPPPADDDDERPSRATGPRRLMLLAAAGARRVVRKETAALADRAGKLAGKPDAWGSWLVEFYREHAAFVAEALELEPSVAQTYAERHRAAIAAGGLAAAGDWQTTAVEELTRLALEEDPVHAA